MNGGNTINALLEAFKGCRERGEQATLFLETRDGGEFATLRVNLPASHKSHSASKTVLGSTKNKTPNKSPSTLKRDRERLINFIKKKRQESWSDNETSTPLTKIQSLPEPVHSQPGTPAMDNKVCDEVVDNEKRADESDEKEEKGWSQEDFEIFKKLLKESFSKFPTKSDILRIGEKTKDEKSDVENEEDNENLEDAKLWAKNQKSTWLNK